MTATLTQVRQALAAALDAIPDLNAHAFAPGAVTAPAVVVKPATGQFLNYRPTMGTGAADAADLLLVVGLFVAGTDEEASSEELDAYLADSGTRSVYAAVAADPTLGGLVDDVALLSATNYGSYTYGSANFYGCEFPVAVLL